MKVGINYCSLRGGLEGVCTVSDSIIQCHENNYSFLELNFSSKGIINPNLTIKECNNIRKRLQMNNIQLESCSSGMSWEYNPTSLQKDIREKSINLHIKALKCASELGASSFLFVPGIVNSPISIDSVPYCKAMEYAKEAIDRLLPICEDYNIKLCLENVWNGLLISPIEFRTFLSTFSSNYLGCYFDVGNVLVYHQNPVDWIIILKDYIDRIHIKDFKVSVGTLNGFCDLLAGDVKWKNVMEALSNINYKNTLIAEILPWDPGSLKRNRVAIDTLLGYL